MTLGLNQEGTRQKYTYQKWLTNRSWKDYLVRAALPKINETGRCEPCGKKTCLVCNSIRTTTTFTTEACGEVFKIQSGPLNCNSEKVLYLLKCKVCGEAAYVGKAKTKFRYRFNNYKANIELSTFAFLSSHFPTWHKKSGWKFEYFKNKKSF